MKKIFILTLFSLGLSSCGTLYVNVPLAQIKSPDTHPGQRFEINASYVPSKVYTSTEDASDRPPTLISKVEDSYITKGDFNFTPVEGLLLGGGLSTEMGLTAQAQYQFLQSKTGWIASIYVDAYYNETRRNGDQNGDLGPSGYNWNGKLSVMGGDLGLSAGYALNEHFLIYFGVAGNSFALNTDIKHDVSNDGTDQGGTYSQKASGTNKTVGLGLQAGWRVFKFKPSVAWTDFTVNGTTETKTSGALSLAWAF